ncbi:MAG TPA: gamma-glutamyltransferase [Xanthobacteraceae bacterium]|nr:gamma-glutamyltransferase [Xanthobacteraceae bacterium]
MLKRRQTILAVLAFHVGLAWPAAISAQQRFQERLVEQSSGTPAAQVATARHGMVSSQDQQATRIGLDVLEKGGNAVDAAVAIGFALAVTVPKAGNIGGGGFMLVHMADRNENAAIDYREIAPAATSVDVFLGPDQQADPAKSRDSGLGVGVPGTVAGLNLALDRFGSGKFSLEELVAPAVRLARDGITIKDDLYDSLQRAQQRLARWPAAARIFLKSDGTAPTQGDRLAQPELAEVLETIGREGPRAFYIGPIADKIVTSVRQAGGLMTRVDLENYAPVIRNPVYGTYRGYEIVSMPPPSSGGVHLVEMLNILEGYSSGIVGSGSPAALHLQLEAMKFAYADRAQYLGDSDSVDVPVERLISKDHATELREKIDARRAIPAREIGPDIGLPSGGNTTHFSVVDAAGNVVANTYSLNFNFGLGMVAEGTGILVNNELDDFAAKSGAPNAFGLVGGAANAPGPGKRPLSSMSPTIVLKDTKPVLVTGAPGGSRIITTVLQILVNAIDGHMTIGKAITAPRLHHQWSPDEVVVESHFPADKARALAAMGHKVRFAPLFGSAHSIAITPEAVTGAADLRARGAAAAGY